MKVAIIGGGAAGFFSALAAKAENPDAEVLLLERSAKLLSKVRISGGGRCNVTHACFDPRELVKNYPRGSRELLGPFHRFQPQDTIEWFRSRGVELKEEVDGRMFPTTDSSETIIQCFLDEAKALGVEIRTQTLIKAIRQQGYGFELDTGKGGLFQVDRLILATGSSRGGWEFAKSLGHSIQDPVPSLFTFNVPSSPLLNLSGVSLEKVRLSLDGFRVDQEGPLLLTHWGFSGPAALKLSAKAARLLAEKEYKITLNVDWIPDESEAELAAWLEQEKLENGSKQLGTLRPRGLPRSLWKELLDHFGVGHQALLRTLSKGVIARICASLKKGVFLVEGKTTNKEEFVTCGGVTLSEVNFKTMESKCCEHLYFCGEVLDIDGVTGGFNFQNAWTTGWLAGRAAVE